MKVDLKKYNACKEAIEYLDSHNGDFIKAWEKCHRGDWMLWIASKLKIDFRVLTLAKGKCAETVIHLMTDARSINAVKVAIDFGLGKVNKKELDNAAAAAFAAAFDDADDAADAAATAAFDAAFDSAADDAADAAAYAAAAADDDDAAEMGNKKLTANICRDILTKSVFKKLNDNESRFKKIQRM